MNDKITKAFLYFIAMVTLGPLIIVPLVLYSGWAITTAWNWLMVPIFGLKVLTIAQGVALALVVSYLTHENPGRDKEQQKKQIIWLVCRPLFLVGIAWIVKGYI